MLYQFFLQLSSGVVVTEVMQDLHLTALLAGFLSSAFYYIYAVLQIPVGVLFDRYSTRYLMGFSIFILSIGCFLFSEGHTFFSLFFARLMIGFGSAFAFIGLSHLLRSYFPLKQFAVMIGFAETLGFFVSVAGMIGLGLMIAKVGWRPMILYASFFGILLGFFAIHFIPKQSEGNLHIPILRDLKDIMSRPILWVNGLFAGLSFSVITVFAAMWALPFFVVKFGVSLKTASAMVAMLYCGAAVGCPLFGDLVERIQKRQIFMMLACMMASFLLFILIFYPISSIRLAYWLMFLLGLSSGAYMLAYSVANELSPQHARSTCTGFVNTLAVMVAPILQPLIGYFLDRSAQGASLYHVEDYQHAFVIMPVCLLVAGILSAWLPDNEKTSVPAT